MEESQSLANPGSMSLLSRLAPLLPVVLVALAFAPSVELLYARWIKWDEGLSHGLIIVGLFLFFILKSSPWVCTPQKTFLFGLLTLCLLSVSAIWFLGHLANIYILEQLAIIPAVILLCAVLFGWRTTRNHLALLLLPIFSIPIWDALNDSLVFLSSLIVGKLVQLVGMPAVIDGNSIFIPFGHILIADGCSGIRYFIIALALGYTIAYLNNYRTAKFFLTLALAALLGLIANWVRIFALVIIGYQTEMQSSLMSNHEYFGWALFAVICFPAIYLAPVVTKSIPSNTNFPGTILSIAWTMAAILALSVGPLLNLFFNPEPQPKKIVDLLPSDFAPIPSSRMPLTVIGPDADHNEYAQKGRVYIELDHYQRHHRSDKLVPYINRLFDNQRWTATDKRTLAPGLEVIQFRNKSTSENLLQSQWFVINGMATSDLRIAKLKQIPAIIAKQNHFMIISAQIRCTAADCDEAQSELSNVAKKLLNLTQEP